MWLSVGSSSSFIDGIGHVGMFGVFDHITRLVVWELAPPPLLWSVPFRSEIAVLWGPRGVAAGGGFGPKPLRRLGPGNPVPVTVGTSMTSRHPKTSDSGRQRLTGVYRRGWSFRQTTSRGAALKIELYVPDTMPIRSASAKPFKVSPPATRIATRTRTTVKLVMIERTAVCMMLRFTTWSNESLWLTRRFSRIRSKTTMVSWTEKPTTVSTAVTNRLLISPILR